MTKKFLVWNGPGTYVGINNSIIITKLSANKVDENTVQSYYLISLKEYPKIWYCKFHLYKPAETEDLEVIDTTQGKAYSLKLNHFT